MARNSISYLRRPETNIPNKNSKFQQNSNTDLSDYACYVKHLKNVTR